MMKGNDVTELAIGFGVTWVIIMISASAIVHAINAQTDALWSIHRMTMSEYAQNDD